ncbi:tyrosine-type recombinase/integrase [Rubrivirga sp. S365]|uniref:Tyrosine-type recombinase/integrase n=1 Tax=Rubrivirga litoralis TaxID=3075598 RepID=A0ABU3BTQ0_9BACT|nr:MULTISPECIES: tyrosine-type recombinase/integrase [unclassified Rubrivirga]MDT0632668.1 tyrosine-type recombinase/integrase [Rubrivirga sp. F394]MDT7857155.1 tyrosine-type recombinase/integrase [Rubrivirga sp. S365]
MNLPAHPSGDHPARPLGAAFSEQSDLVPLYLLRFDRDNTRRAYGLDLEHFFGTGTVTLQMARTVSFTHVNEFVARLEADGLSPATIRRRLAAVRGFFSWLVALGLLSLNPADRQLVRRVTPDRPQDRVLTVLTKDESVRLLSGIDLDTETGPRNHALVSTLLHCVLRRSEAAAMDFEHIVRARPYWVLRLPRAKGGANQTVKIPEHVVESIESLKDTYGYRSGAIWRSLSRNRSRGQRLSTTSVYMIVNRAAKDAGISGTVGAHTLRHTGCTMAIENGASIQQVQIHARHKNVETTMRYVHQRDRLANSAADFIDLTP